MKTGFTQYEEFIEVEHGHQFPPGLLEPYPNRPARTFDFNDKKFPNMPKHRMPHPELPPHLVEALKMSPIAKSRHHKGSRKPKNTFKNTPRIPTPPPLPSTAPPKNRVLLPPKNRNKRAQALFEAPTPGWQAPIPKKCKPASSPSPPPVFSDSDSDKAVHDKSSPPPATRPSSLPVKSVLKFKFPQRAPWKPRLLKPKILSSSLPPHITDQLPSVSGLFDHLHSQTPSSPPLTPTDAEVSEIVQGASTKFPLQRQLANMPTSCDSLDQID